jgi:hypothetical protein
MKTTKILAVTGAGLISGLLLSQPAFAYWPFAAHVRNDRTEIRSDYSELNRDRRELYRDLRNGAPAGEIAHDKAEIRRDWRELQNDRWDLNRDYARYYGHGSFDRYGYWHPDWR